MLKNILTAIDIDGNKKSLDKKIQELVENFNKSRIRKQVKKLRDELKLEYPNEPEKQIISKEKTKEIAEEIYADEETQKYSEYQKLALEQETDNYFVLRYTLQDLNELNEFSAEIERNEIQVFDNLKSYDKLLDLSLSKLSLYHKIVDIRKTNIDNLVASFNGKTNNEDSLKLLLTARELYQIKKDVDDIDLFEKFNMLSNIDYSNKLSDICLQKTNDGNFHDNIINEFSNKNNIVSRLSKNQIINNKLLGILLRSSVNTENIVSFVTNNAVSCLSTMYTNNFTNENIYTTRTLGELLFEITNEELKDIDKINKQQIYMTYDGTRPSTEDYVKWNGLQVYDIDLKEWNGNIENLKQKIFDYLTEFNWFLWVCKSASGKGIHIYTKVAPPHHVHININENEYLSKYWYYVSYYTKLSVIYDVLYRIHKGKNSITFDDCFIEGFENKFVDNSVGRLTSGIRLTYDPLPLVNHNFIDLHIGLNLNQTLDGFNYITTIKNLFFRETKLNKLAIERINTLSQLDSVKKETNNSLLSKEDLAKLVSIGIDIEDVKPLPRNAINYQLRYNVCNTLAALFGKEGLQIAHTLLDSAKCKNVGEINSFYSCALSNRKNPSKYGLEVLKKNGIIKSIEPELKEFTGDLFKNGIRKAIQNSLNNKIEKTKLVLGHNEYLSDKKHILLNEFTGLTNSKINMIFSPPNSGKTEFIKTLARDGKRILLVLPYISVIKNKIETDQELMKIFDCYYGNKDIKQIEYGINAVTTFDKFARSNYEKLSKMFDYVFVDESHLLFTSSYRIEATSNVVKKLKELFFIASNDPFSAKICLLTGTPVGEEFFFSQVANVISVSKKLLSKTMEFIICDDLLDATTRLASKAFDLLNEGYKILIPTNKGEIYSEKMIGMIEYLLGRPVKYGYYKRSNTEQEICRLINDSNTTGDYEIIFCSNYLSVGVDINDTKVKFASIYLGPFSGYEIEQFNSRMRKTDIKSIYCIQTQKGDGNTNDLLLEEPNLLLRLTVEDKENFTDDKAIAGAKQEFLIEYDPVLHKIATPGFSYLNGKIRFNLEEYELISFENKYNECMQHPVKVARELDKFGYVISIDNNFDGLDLTIQEELKKIGIIAAKEEKIRKHSLLVGTFIELVQKNSFTNKHGLEYTDIIGWIGKNSDKIFEDREQLEFINIEFDVFATPLSVTVRSKEALDSMYKPAKYLASKYSATKAVSIINEYVDDNGILKQKLFKRAINLLKLMDSSDANELTDPLTKMLENMYNFVDQFELNKEYRVSYNTYKSMLESWTNEYIDALGIRINTLYAFEKIQDSIQELLSDISTKSTSKTGLKFTYNKLPDTDSNIVLNRRSVDNMIDKMFKITGEAIIINKHKKKHILLLDQNF